MESTTSPVSARNHSADSFARFAANACLISAPFVFALALVFSLMHPAGRMTPERQTIVALGVLFCLGVVAVGAVMGIVAIVLSSHHFSVILRAAGGLLLIALFLAMTTQAFVKARRRARDNRQALQEVQAAGKDLNSQVLASLRNPKKHPVSLTGLQDSLNRAAAESHGSESAAFRGSSSFLAQLQSHRSAYDQALRELTSAKVLVVTNLTSRDQIRERKAVVGKFLKANEALKTFITQSESNYQKTLTDSGTSADQTQSAVAGFDKKVLPQMSFLTRIRDADDRMGQGMLGTLDVLDTHWGRWHYDQRSRQVRFNDHAAVESYNAFMASIRQARDDGTAAQRGLATVLTQGASTQQGQ